LHIQYDSSGYLFGAISKINYTHRVLPSIWFSLSIFPFFLHS